MATQGASGTTGKLGCCPGQNPFICRPPGRWIKSGFPEWPTNVINSSVLPKAEGTDEGNRVHKSPHSLRRWSNPLPTVFRRAALLPDPDQSHPIRPNQTKSNQIRPPRQPPESAGVPPTQPSHPVKRSAIRPDPGYSGLLRLFFKKISENPKDSPSTILEQQLLATLMRSEDGSHLRPVWRKNLMYFQKIKVNQSKSRYFLYPTGRGGPGSEFFRVRCSGSTLQRRRTVAQ